MRVQRVSFIFGVAALIGCVANPGDTPTRASTEPKTEVKKADEKKAEAKKVELGKNIFLEVEGDVRRVLLKAEVCNRQTILEQLLTKKGTKEHEAILAAEIDAREVHAALVLAKAEPGKPVGFRPKFTPPTGSTIKVTLEYENDGTKIRVRPQEWIINRKSKKELHTDWVFGGSRLDQDPLDPKKKPYYAANGGDVICISNFESAMLDVPFDSTKDNDDLSFETNTEKIPALKTPVLVILEPVIVAKKK